VRLGDLLGALSEREFRLLFLARAFSLFGSAIAPIALAFAVLDLTGSPSDLGLVLAARTLPQMLFLLVGGIWADRLPRYRVMLASDVASAAAQVAVGILLVTGNAEIWQLMALQAVSGTALAFFLPASAGLVPQTVSAPRLQQANALLRLAINGSTVGGAAAGGVLVAVVGSGWALTFDGATFLVSAGFLSMIRLSAADRLPRRNFLEELGEGWREFRSRTWLWSMVFQVSFVNASYIGAFFVLGPVVADRSLGGPAAWGGIVTANAVGFVLGGLVALRFKPRRPLLSGTLLIFLMALPLVSLALGLPLVVVAASALVAGVAMEIFGVLWDTTVQQQVPAEKLSRVSSYDQLGSFGFIPIGYSVVGLVSATLGVSETLWAAAAVVLIATAAVLPVRDVRHIRRKDLEPEPSLVAT
jgi:MFS family permease